MKAEAACNFASAPFALSIFAAASCSPLETFASVCLLLSCAAAATPPTPSTHAHASAHAERILNFKRILNFICSLLFLRLLFPDPTVPVRLHQRRGQRPEVRGQWLRFPCRSLSSRAADSVSFY